MPYLEKKTLNAPQKTSLISQPLLGKKALSNSISGTSTFNSNDINELLENPHVANSQKRKMFFEYQRKFGNAYVEKMVSSSKATKKSADTKYSDMTSHQTFNTTGKSQAEEPIKKNEKSSPPQIDVEKEATKKELSGKSEKVSQEKILRVQESRNVDSISDGENETSLQDTTKETESSTDGISKDKIIGDSTQSHQVIKTENKSDTKKLLLDKKSENKDKERTKPKPKTDEGFAGKQIDKAPTSPAEDPEFQNVVKKAKGIAKKQKAHVPAKRKAKQAQDAASGPPNEVKSKAASRHVGEMSEQKPISFDTITFEKALIQKIDSVAPKNLEEMDNFKSSGKLNAIKSSMSQTVAEGKQKAQGNIEKKNSETPSTAGIRPTIGKKLKINNPGPFPSQAGAEKAAPKPKTESEVSLDKGSKDLDDRMAQEDVTERQLLESNENSFISAVDEKRVAQKHSVEAPQTYRQDEQAILNVAKVNAQKSAKSDTNAMHKVRKKLYKNLDSLQVDTKTKDEKERLQVANDIQKMFESTKEKVEIHLNELEKNVNTLFEDGASFASRAFEDYVKREMAAYKERRYSGWRGKLRKARDWFAGLPGEADKFYSQGRLLFLQQMKNVIRRISAVVSTGLNKAIDIIQQGKQQISEYINNLDDSLKKYGMEAQENVQSKFTRLEQSVKTRQEKMINSLAQKYNEKLGEVDARIEQMKAENSGLINKALNALKGVWKAIKNLKELLMKVADVAWKIIKAPIRFLSTLISGVKAGLNNFVTNIGQHLKKGLAKWVFGNVGSDIPIPEDFSVKSIIPLVLAVLGITYANIRARAVKLLGEEIVSRLEQAAEIFKILITQGPKGLWKWFLEKLSDLKTIIIDGIIDFVKTSIIQAGISWVLGLLTPAGAFIKACKAIYNIIKFFVQRAKQIADLIQAIFESLSAFAEGKAGIAAVKVEKALANAIPVVIGFLAGLLGLGGISEKIRAIIQKIRKPINKTIDWIINKAAGAVKAAGKLFGIGKKNKKGKEGLALDKEEATDTDPQKNMALTAGLAAIDKEEDKYLDKGEITRKEAEEVVKIVQQKHPVFRFLSVVDGGKSWDYEYAASPKKTKKGPIKDKNSLDDWPTGTQSDPIPIKWYKKSSIYPTINNQNLISGITLPSTSRLNSEVLKVARANILKKDANIKRASRGNESIKTQVSWRLKESNLKMSLKGDYAIDHVRDLAWGGNDDYQNLWPLEKDLNNRVNASHYQQARAVEGKEVKTKAVRSWGTDKYFWIAKVDDPPSSPGAHGTSKKRPVNSGNGIPKKKK